MKNRDNQKITGKEKHDRISILKNQIKQLKINNKPKDDIKLEKLEIELYNLENINNIKDISINSQKSYKENIKKPLVIQNNNKQINKFDSKVIENQKIQINDLKKQNDSFNSKIKNLTKSNDLLKKQFDTSNSKIKEFTKNNEILKKENANLIKSNLIKFKALENQKNQIINNLKKQNDTSNLKLKELTKNNEALKKENANSIKSKTLENQKKEIKELTKQITELNISNNEQKATIKKLSKINSKTINSLEKNFKFLLYWNYLESNYQPKKDDLILEKIEVSKERFLLSLREFLSIYKTTLNIKDDRFDVMKKIIPTIFKSTSNERDNLILNLNKLAHVDDAFWLKDKEKNFIKTLFTESNYRLFFPNIKEQELHFKGTYYDVLRSYYVAPSTSINLYSLVKTKPKLKN